MDGFFVKKKSGVHGIGIFTKIDIKKNSTFYKIPLIHIFNKPRPKFAYIGNNIWVSDERILNYVNNSCNPNSLLNVMRELKLIAKRNIKAGEEITIDYNKTEKNGVKVPCTCQSKNCRKYFLKIE